MKLALAALALAACNLVPAPSTPVLDTPVINADIATAATFMILAPDGSQGTGWAAGARHVVTAGHVCDGGKGQYMAVSNDLQVFTVTPLVWEDLFYSHRPPIDICVMGTEETLRVVLPLAPQMPYVGQRAEYVGFPSSIYKHSVGEYRGDIDGPEIFLSDYASTAPCAPGASGSAMFTEDGVYGVLVRLAVIGDQVLPGSMGCVASPLDQIVDVLDTI